MLGFINVGYSTDLLAQNRDTSQKLSSQLVISTAIGNSPYKLENAKGGASGVAFIKPGLAYYHKSGWGISAYTYSLLGRQFDGLFEYDVTPAYDFFKGKAFSFGFAYSHYFFNNHSSLEASPLRNEFYGYVNYNKFWLQPGIALDMAAGSYKDTLGGIHSASDVDLFPSLTHEFSFFSLFSDQDELDISPGTGVMIGTDKFVRSFGSNSFVRHLKSKNHVITRKKKTAKKSTKKVYTNTYSNPQAQFIPRFGEFSVDISYSIGKFTFDSQYFYDLPLTKDEIKDSYFLITLSLGF